MGNSSNHRIDLSAEAWNRVREGRQVVDAVLRSGKVVPASDPGFGNFANTIISPDKLGELPSNVVRSRHRP